MVMSVSVSVSEPEAVKLMPAPPPEVLVAFSICSRAKVTVASVTVNTLPLVRLLASSTRVVVSFDRISTLSVMALKLAETVRLAVMSI